MRRRHKEAIVPGGLRGHGFRLISVVGGLAALFYIGGAPIMFGT